MASKANDFNDDDLEIKMADPGGNLVEHVERHITSHLSFNQLKLPKAIVDGLLQMNYRAPSKIQAMVIPLVTKDPPQNLICQSQTGTGKTAAYTIAMLQRVDISLMAPQALCIVPTRELARQVVVYVNTVAQFMPDITTELCVPKSNARGTKIAAHIVVGTPGTTQSCLRHKQLDASKLKIFVLDEADNMLESSGVAEMVIRSLKFLPNRIQTMMFSATWAPELLTYAKTLCPNPHTITLQRHELTMKGIKQIYMDCKDEEDKYRVLVMLYHVMTVASSIIFVKRRDTADRIARRMEAEGHKVAVLHAGLHTVTDRDEIIDSFRHGKCKVLVTTNVLARGIDVATTSMVINYDLPRTLIDAPDPVTYLHRIGRTGRFGRDGISISFVHDARSWQELQEIQSYFGVSISLVPADDVNIVENMIEKIMKSNNEMLTALSDMKKSRHAPKSNGF